MRIVEPDRDMSMNETSSPSAALDQFIPTRDAAALLGITPRRVLQLIEKERLPATKVGPIFLMRRSDVARLTHRPPGRPRKSVA